MCDLGLLGQEAFERTRAFYLSFRNISERDFIPNSTRMQPRVPSGIDSQGEHGTIKVGSESETGFFSSGLPRYHAR